MLLLMVLLFVFGAQAQTNAPPRGMPTGWSPSIRGGSVYTFDTDLDAGGGVSVHRYYVEGGLAYLFRPDRMVSFSAGYGQDDYRFSGTPALWGNIDSYRAGAFVRWGLDKTWSLFAAPSFRTYAEEGASHSDAWTGGLFAGAAYRFSKKLTVGPALGIIGQLEDSPRYFPVLIIDWSITDRWSLGTGGGLGATQGPGLGLHYKATDKLKLSLSGRYESKRFRLDRSGVAPNGVGEDESVAVFGIFSYVISERASISAILGYDFGGKLRVEDENGGYVSSTDYKNAPTVGLAVSINL